MKLGGRSRGLQSAVNSAALVTPQPDKQMKTSMSTTRWEDGGLAKDEPIKVWCW